MTLRIFNPSHDECLASGSPYYTPSLTARQMDEVHLPGWLCLSEVPSYVSAHGGWDAVSVIEPWGWDARLAHQLRRCGCPERLLPTAEELATIRRLSSRQTAVKILPQLTDKFESWWLEALPLGEEGREVLYKSPWSCSGRGVFPYNEARIRKVIKEQGGIEVEPLYDRVADFATEWRCHGGELHFTGYAAMINDTAGHYGGNLAITSEEALHLMTQYVPLAEVETTQEALAAALRREIAPYYTGPLGVDHMIVRREDGGYALHPCVEINLRYTMGHIALTLAP